MTQPDPSPASSVAAEPAATPTASSPASSATATPTATAAAAATGPSVGGATANRSWLAGLATVLAVAAGLAALLLWQKLANIQEALAQQSAQATQQSAEALALAKQSATLAQDATAQLTLAQARLNELSTQRSQVDELLQSLTKAKDDSLLVDVEAALHAAVQQSMLTGSLQPMIQALSTAHQRVKKANAPRLVALQMALERDLSRLQQVKVLDVSLALNQLDALLNSVPRWPLLGEALPAKDMPKLSAQDPSQLSWVQALGQGEWWMVLQDMGRELLALVQISKVASPDVLLMTPDQRELVRQQLRMHILSARMSLVARQPEAVQQDLDQVRRLMNHHVSLNTPTAAAAKGQLTALEQSLKQLEWPELKDSLTALNQLQAGR